MEEITSREQKELIPSNHIILIIKKPKSKSFMHRASCPSLNIISSIIKNNNIDIDSNSILDYPFPRNGKYFHIDPTNEDLNNHDVKKHAMCMSDHYD